jgi:GT2 family glycosyltransferase
MSASAPGPSITICLLSYGDYPRLVRRALDSIRENCPRSEYTLAVGANEVCQETRELLDDRLARGDIDRLHSSPTNVGKSPMMRRIFAEVRTDFIWWFDDDAYITEAGALSRWLQITRSSPPTTVLWGQAAVCEYPSAFTRLENAVGWVRSATWYKGLPPPSWRPGGKGEFNYGGRGLGDGRWFFVLGGCFLVRTSAIRELDWPDQRLFIQGDDTFLGEAIRQHGWDWGNIGTPGVIMAPEPSRGLRI